ncbi:hypothetical protein EST38_g7583 [Candolleomyces aberdarensis]|uniref:Uncharacterized protein n=1 Tax=Candolleomyces aberdarensis TaxID=2316362 RepID=A0A4Q2DHN3_9AGAR|nr:hypothetical protein EST38_g7583 [Candolleomyces aberdarensis]
MASVSSSATAPSGPTRRGRFYHETVVFEARTWSLGFEVIHQGLESFGLLPFLQVEGTLHRVYRYGFEKRSRIFRNIFQNPQGEPPNVEGQSDANPIRLVGCTNSEFESLVEVMYPLDLGPPELSKREWIAVLKLSKLWEMTEFRPLSDRSSGYEGTG